MKQGNAAFGQSAKMLPDGWVSVALRVLIGCVFVYAGFQKAAAPAEEFAAVVEAYYLLPPDWVLPFAQILPWLELIFGVYLIAGYKTRISSAAIAAMLASFVFALGAAIVRHIPLENCGCFGSGFHLDPRYGIFFDIAMMLCAVWLVRAPISRWSADAWVQQGSD